MENIYNDNNPENTMDNHEEYILKMMQGLTPPQGLSKEEARQKLQEKINSKTTIKGKQNKSRVLVYWSMAASVLIIIGLMLFFNRAKEVNVITAAGEKTEYKLPDGSVVYLNAMAEIKFDANSFKKHRNIQLNGEAYFEVQKGSDFIVSTPNGNVQVLGTSFNVSSREGDFKVSCLTGKVRVEAGSSNQIITKGQMVTLVNNKLEKTVENNIEKNIGWRYGQFNFENEKLEQVFSEIERQFNIKIEYKGNTGRYFTGQFTNKNLNQALDIICIPMELKYEINKQVIIIQ